MVKIVALSPTNRAEMLCDNPPAGVAEPRTESREPRAESREPDSSARCSPPFALRSPKLPAALDPWRCEPINALAGRPTGLGLQAAEQLGGIMSDARLAS